MITNGPVCNSCACVSEYHRNDGEGAELQELVRLSYTRRYISLARESARVWGLLRSPMELCVCVSEYHRDDGEGVVF